MWKVARQFFSNSNITVNLLPALIIGGRLFDSFGSFYLIFSWVLVCVCLIMCLFVYRHT